MKASLRRHLRFVVTVLAMVAILAGTGTWAALDRADAAPTSGDYIMRAVDQQGIVREVVYVAQGVKTMAGANTPVNSTAVCGLGEFDLHVAEVTLSGTMTGTAPTLAIKWQNSYDGGTTWRDVGAWTTINATVTPATQSQTVSDVQNATTAVAYGDCWRAQYTFGGSGTVTANIGIHGYVED
jgi:hypothetical protein